SHLPHVVAYALAGTLKKEYAKYTSTGFKDTTRIASSDPVLWSDVFLSNKDNVLESIRGFRNIVEKIEDDIRNGREQELKERLGLCKGIRDEIV
ncbi:MAG: prephenate dehydrogenase, partial [Candidatus Omnitrophica bacterium]|nr:prephenate dehydrogenase [Candidatus Omnitrophota bacterium]